MAFKWHDKFGEAMMRIPDEAMRERFSYALTLYGTTGELPALSWPLDALVGAFLEDVDYSRSAMEQGAKGGRPRRDEPAGEKPQAKGVSKKAEKGVSENPERGVSENPETHDMARHDMTGHGIEVGSAPAPAMEPPSVEEVVGYARCQTLEVPDLKVEAQRFVDHFAAQGWVRGNQVPVRDWRPLWRSWVSRRGEFDSRGQPAERAGAAREQSAALARRYGEDSRTEEVR